MADPTIERNEKKILGRNSNIRSTKTFSLTKTVARKSKDFVFTRFVFERELALLVALQGEYLERMVCWGNRPLEVFGLGIKTLQ